MRMSGTMTGPIREMMVWARGQMSAIFSFSQSAIEMLLVDSNGLGASAVDRTPAGFVANANYNWSVDTLYNSGGSLTAVLACAVQTLVSIDDATNLSVFIGNASDNAAFTAIAGVGPSGTGVSGGVFCTAPYAVYYGTDGYVQWSDVNQPTVLTSGDAGSARVTGAKIVRGLPLRSGSGPAALLWSLDSVIRMEYIGGPAIFKFTTLTSEASILSPRSVIEYDDTYYWVGQGRFLMSNGGSVTELHNDMNLNWFFDNLNYSQKMKVWAMKVPRYGEIWWFYPRGTATECTHAVIYNVREKLWYDTELGRSAGYYSQVFNHPIMAGDYDEGYKKLTITITGGSINVGDYIQGVISGARATVLFISGTSYTVLVVNSSSFISGESLTDTTSGGTGTLTAITLLYDLYLHETEGNYDAVEGDSVSAIPSFFETCNFGYPTGSTQIAATQGLNKWARITRVEPDFNMTGEMSLVVTGNEYAQSAVEDSDPYLFEPYTPTIDTREMRRHLRLRFSSNVVGGFYEMGNVILWLEPGDTRA